MTEWKEYKLSDIGTIVGGATPSTKDASNYDDGEIAWLTPKDLSSFTERYISRGERNITEKGFKSSSTQMLPANTVLFSSRAPIGYVAIAANEMCTNQGFKSIIPNSKVDYLFLYYLLKYKKNAIEGMGSGTTFKEVSGNVMKNIEVQIPTDINIQKKIADVLDKIDSKIENNTAINRNLEEQALALYYRMFVETKNDGRITCRTDEFFEITIGKTPPRKEKEWFSEIPSDCVWISISDMGSSGTFINDSSEYLTPEAVEKFNVKVVPDNTVILSFKLTVGRIAITVGPTTTNEAIAHFNTDNQKIVEYLYCYLKSFDFGALGSTSSIGIAVNSKTIKAMDFLIPEDGELQEFFDIVHPMFQQIKNNQFENQRLIAMRDSLLPKLMSGELDVSDIEI